MAYSKKESEYLLKLARDAVASAFNKKPLKIANIPPPCLDKRSCFVTLTQDGGQLRGCIGHILPTQELYKNVIGNARAAAFSDPRFPPLKPDELDKIKIEISIIGSPQKLALSDKDAMLRHLEKNKPGVIIKKGPRQATFLPQVWQQLPNPADFLTHLCHKAGLGPNEWKNDLEIEIYDVEKIKET